MRLLGTRGVVLAAVVATGVGCGARTLVVDAGGQGDDARVVPPPPGNDLLSDFEIEPVARIQLTGSPPRNGTWYSYNDMGTTCVQEPPVGALHHPSAPTPPSPGPSGGLALHASWSGCGAAGIGAGLNVEEPADGAASTQRPYDLTGYTGITFWAKTTPGFDTHLRVSVVMRANIPIRDGGSCDEDVAGVDKCGDHWGAAYLLPVAGNWRQIVLPFSFAGGFQQEGWGATIAWNPSDVVAIQIQSERTEVGMAFDFWIDDVYLLR
jgi:hypothetical protein